MVRRPVLKLAKSLITVLRDLLSEVIHEYKENLQDVADFMSMSDTLKGI